MKAAFYMIGRTVAEIETHEKVSHFRLAVEEKPKKDGEEDKKVSFYRISVFGGLKEFLDKEGNLPKGTKVFVAGEMEQAAPYEKDGKEIHGYSFVAREFEYCQPKVAE